MKVKHKGIRNDLERGVNMINPFSSVIGYSFAGLNYITGQIGRKKPSLNFVRGGVVVRGGGLVPKGNGIALGNFAVAGGHDSETFRHESAHIQQYNEMGTNNYLAYLGRSPLANMGIGNQNTLRYENEANRRAGDGPSVSGLYLNLFLIKPQIGVQFEYVGIRGANERTSGTFDPPRFFHFYEATYFLRRESHFDIYKRKVLNQKSYYDFGIGAYKLYYSWDGYYSYLPYMDFSSLLGITLSYDARKTEEFNRVGPEFLFRYSYLMTSWFNSIFEIYPVYIQGNMKSSSSANSLYKRIITAGFRNSTERSFAEENRKTTIYGVKAKIRFLFNIYKWINLEMEYDYSRLKFNFSKSKELYVPYSEGY